MEAAVLFLIISLFLAIGSTAPSFVSVRMVYGGLLLLVSLLFLRNVHWGKLLKSPAVMLLIAFLGFLLMRSVSSLGWSSWGAITGKVDPDRATLLGRYAVSPLPWIIRIGFFALGTFLFKRRRQATRLLWVLCWCGFLLALAAIPPLLLRGQAGYLTETGAVRFFPPIFYSHRVLSEYLIAHTTHPNYAGDLIALGFFPALGLFIYGLGPKVNSIASLGLLATFASVSALGVVLFFSRGTLISFSTALVIYLLAGLIKFPSRAPWLIGGVMALLLAGFFLGAVNLQNVWKEIATVKEELDPGRASSFSAIREGTRRSVAIYQDHPIGGVGTGGYELVSEKYRPLDVGDETYHSVANSRAMCHYLQVLAEEGMGAYLYFLFLAAYFFEAGRGLLRTKSRLQYLAGLSLVAPVLMVLTHATVNHLMEQFTISWLVFILMGASLGILREDFESTRP